MVFDYFDGVRAGQAMAALIRNGIASELQPVRQDSGGVIHRLLVEDDVADTAKETLRAGTLLPTRRRSEEACPPPQN